jgi:hypothetical protein
MEECSRRVVDLVDSFWLNTNPETIQVAISFLRAIGLP